MASELRVDRIIPVNGIPTGGGGGIVQIVQDKNSTQGSTTSNSLWTQLGPTASITPTSVSSKILICYQMHQQNRTNSCHVLGRIYKDAANLTDIGLISFQTTADDNIQYLTGMWLDSPATTSSVTYDLRFKLASSNTGSFYVNYPESKGSETTVYSMMTLMEVSG